MINGWLVGKLLVGVLGLLCFLLAIYFLLRIRGMVRGQGSLSDTQVAVIEKSLLQSKIFGWFGGVCLVLSLVWFVY